LLTSYVAFLLLTIASNPGPSAVRFGVLNAGCAVRKGALIEDFIHDNHLDVLAVCESWIREDAPDAIKNDIAPSGYSVLHVHRPRENTVECINKRGSGLALIYSNDLSARPLKTKFLSTSFEFQLIGLQVGKVLVKVANIYRPPSRKTSKTAVSQSSKTVFLEEFTDLISMIGPGINERLIICGDFNMPDGDKAGAIDERLANLLDVHGYQQHVTGPTRGKNLLDLVITPASTSPPLVSNVVVQSSHGASDHDLVVCDLSVWRHKLTAVNYSYRNIRGIDLADFEKRLRSSRLFTDPADTPDGYLGQLESTVTMILDELAPMRHGTRPCGRKGAKWLEPEAVAAKQLRRRLERRWKKSGHESDRAAYRATCQRANTLINSSRNRHRYQRVVEAGNNSRRVWSAVKDLLYINQHDPITKPTEVDSVFCSTLAKFFVNKVCNIKTAISSSLAGQKFDPCRLIFHRPSLCLNLTQLQSPKSYGCSRQCHPSRHL